MSGGAARAQAWIKRTTKNVECLHHEARRQACKVSIFPNQVSCLPLVSGVFKEKQ
jgi:transposase-like protein